jgi:hypothetical protein
VDENGEGFQRHCAHSDDRISRFDVQLSSGLELIYNILDWIRQAIVAKA